MRARSLLMTHRSWRAFSADFGFEFGDVSCPARCLNPVGSPPILWQQQIHILQKKLTAILKVTCRSMGSRPVRIGSLRENPRIPKNATPDEHAADAGASIRARISSGSKQSPEPRTGMVTDSATRSIRLQSECPEIRLRCRSGREQRPPTRPPLRRASDTRRVNRLIVPAARIFTVTGIFTRFVIAAITEAACSGSRVRDAVGVVHARNFRHRTTHVRVNDVSAQSLHDLRGGRPFFRRDRRPKSESTPVCRKLQRAIDATRESLRADHLGHHQPAPAVPFHQATESGIVIPAMGTMDGDENLIPNLQRLESVLGTGDRNGEVGGPSGRSRRRSCAKDLQSLQPRQRNYPSSAALPQFPASGLTRSTSNLYVATSASSFIARRPNHRILHLH